MNLRTMLNGVLRLSSLVTATEMNKSVVLLARDIGPHGQVSYDVTLVMSIQYYMTIILLVIIIIINRQFLTRRNMEPHHPLQGRELSMCREIQCCFDMSIVNYS